MTVAGIRKSAGDFKDQSSGKEITYSNTVVTVLQEYSAKEKNKAQSVLNRLTTRLKALSSLMIICIRSYQPKLS